MKKYSLFYSLIFFVLSFACTSPTKKTEATPINSIDNTEETKNIAFPLLEQNFSKAAFPLQIDTVNFEGKNKLTTDFLLELEKMVKDEEKRYTLQFPALIKLNKLKQGQDPVESGDFDIGETIKLIYYDLGHAFLEQQNNWIAFIGVEYESYPACPWANGREIVLCTFDKQGKLIDLITIAENSEGGDPPVWGTGEKKVFSQNGTEYNLEITNAYGEYNEEGERDAEEINEQIQKISIQSDGKLKIEELKNTEQKKQ